MGTYHEIHEIDNLRSVTHIVFTIESIVRNHMLFKPKNDSLDTVIICGSNYEMIKDVIKYFEIDPIGVQIVETETALYS